MNAPILSDYPSKDFPFYSYGANFREEGDGVNSAVRFRSLAALFVLAVGTGGQCDWRYIQGRQALGYPVMDIAIHEQTLAAPARTAAADLKQVKAAFQASISDLATLFGVTRQTIYDWLSGEQQPRAPHRARLAALLDAASALEVVGYAVSRRVLRQALPDGRSLFDRVRAGEPLADAIDQLMAIFRREALQRETLACHLANRPGEPMDLADFGTPHLPEDL